MSEELKRWAVTERQFIEDNLKWLQAGAKLLSPSGDDVSPNKLKQLQARLAQLAKSLGGGD